MAKHDDDKDTQGTEEEGAGVPDDDLERYLSADDDTDPSKDGGDPSDDNLERSMHMSNMPDPVADTVRAAAPEAYEATPLIQALCKSVQDHLSWMAEAFTMNQQAVENGFNQLSKSVVASVDEQMDMIKSLASDLDDLGRTSSRPSDADPSGGTLQKSSTAVDNGALSMRDVRARLEKAVTDGKLSGDVLTQIELRGYQLTDREAALVKSIELDPADDAPFM